MVKHYYVSDDLDELELVEQELESIGIKESQIHVLSQSTVDVENHHLHMVNSLHQRDVIHSGEIGAVFGAIGALFIIAVTSLMGWAESAAGWMPFTFLAIIIFGFCTWEGGFIGIQKVNVNHVPFEKALKEGKHILLVDSNKQQKQAVRKVFKAHPRIQPAGASIES